MGFFDKVDTACAATDASSAFRTSAHGVRVPGRIVVYHHTTAGLAGAGLAAFAAGCGARVAHISESHASDACVSDIAVVWGWPRDDGGIAVHKWNVINRHGRHNVIFLEHGYLQPGDYFQHEGPMFAAAWGGVVGFGDHCNADSSGVRFQDLRIAPEPWRTVTDRAGRYVLVFGQMPQFGSLYTWRHLPWAFLMFAEMKVRGLRVRFRPHPRIDIRKYEIPSWVERSCATLAEDLAGARAAVTQNSKAAVAAAVAGVPVFAMDRGCIAAPVANHKLDALENPATPDRTQWLNDIAYGQWTLDEMRAGTTFQHLMARRPRTSAALPVLKGR